MSDITKTDTDILGPTRNVIPLQAKLDAVYEKITEVDANWRAAEEGLEGLHKTLNRKNAEIEQLREVLCDIHNIHETMTVSPSELDNLIKLRKADMIIWETLQKIPEDSA